MIDLKAEAIAFLVEKVLSEIFDQLKANFKKRDQQLLTDKNHVKESILTHINYVDSWSRNVSFKDMDNAKSVSKIYVQLNYALNQKRDHLQDVQRLPIELDKILSKPDKHIVVLGQPGAGKTTTMRYICQSIFRTEGFHPKYKIPILVRLRDLSDDSFSMSQDFLFDRLFHTLGLKINEENTKYEYSSISVREGVVKLVDSLGALIILDGFDEISPPEKKDKIIKEFEYLCLNLTQAKAILTSRNGDYSYSIDNTEVYEIASLNDEQIKEFARKWLGKKSFEDLYNQIQKSPFHDTAIRPLTMAHLCALYERYGTIPDKPKNIYKKIINLLVEDWDSQRMINRKSKFAAFTPDRKTEFLSVFAYILTTEIKSSVFTKTEISYVYRKINEQFALRIQDEKDVIIELESQTGLFLQSGYDTFEFAHKSLQEYLTADYIVRLPVIPSDSALMRILPNELAIATAISIDSSMYFATLAIKNFAGVDQTTVRVYLSRLLLENPDFRVEPLLGAAILHLKRLHHVKDTCDNLICELIRKKPTLQQSLLVLKDYYRRNEIAVAEGNHGQVLHKAKPLEKFGVEAPLAVEVNKKILDVLKMSSWP